MKSRLRLFTLIKTFGFSPVILITCTLGASAADLSLQEYLDQVKQQSSSVKASEYLIEGTQQTSKEGDIPTFTRLSLTGSYADDNRQFPNRFQQGSITKNFGLGLERNFNFGLSSKISYSVVNTQYPTVNQNDPTQFLKNFSGAQTQIDLNQSLWRNFFGKETRASGDLAEASSLASHYGEKYKLKQTIAQAETTYYRLAIAQESVKLENDLLDRSRKILEWTTKRVQNHLTDKIDMLQSKAAFQARQISLRAAEQELNSAKVAFNQLRSLDSDEVKDQARLASTDLILSLSAPTRADETDDIKAAQQSERITRASNELSLQKVQPDLSVFASAAFNGIDLAGESGAYTRALTTKHPNYTAGVRLNFAVDLFETAEIRSGRVKQQLAAEATTRQKVIESESNFRDLGRKFKEAQSRLKMADDLVNLQKEKLEYEKYRFNLGRTTTYQVLMFEQDYAQALIQRLRVENEILAYHSQLKTFTN
jgi:outer membrane protein TolC